VHKHIYEVKVANPTSSQHNLDLYKSLSERKTRSEIILDSYNSAKQRFYEEGLISEQQLAEEPTFQEMKNRIQQAEEKIGELEQWLLGWERRLTLCSICPIVPGAVKAIGGAIQLTAGVAAAIFFAIQFHRTKDIRQAQLAKRAATHIVHGGANIVKGLLEAVPILGDISLLIEIIKNPQHESQSDKFLGYAAIYSRGGCKATFAL